MPNINILGIKNFSLLLNIKMYTIQSAYGTFVTFAPQLGHS